MDIKRKFWSGISAFNQELWDDAKEAFEDLEGESSINGAENLFEAMALISSAYNRVHGDDFPDQAAYEQARNEAERALELLQDGMPETVLGIRIHRLISHMEQFVEGTHMSVQPETFRFDLPKTESDTDAES